MSVVKSAVAFSGCVLATPAIVENIMGKSKYDPGVRGARAWNAGKLVGAKKALKPQQVWAIRFMLDREQRVRDRVLFDFAIDSKLRGCDVVKVKIGELSAADAFDRERSLFSARPVDRCNLRF